jgi:hypothetical protein
MVHVYNIKDYGSPCAEEKKTSFGSRIGTADLTFTELGEFGSD